MAFWYVNQPKKEGSIFGYKDNWTGLAVIFDTFDNDGQVRLPPLPLSLPYYL